MSKLGKRVALVTGGARGIGAAIAKKLAQEGADVAILDNVLGDEANSMVKHLQEFGVWATAIQGDVANSNHVNLAVQEVFEHRQRIDILVNNAGICPFRDLLSITDEIWLRTLNVNLTGMFYLARAVAPIMMEQKNGAIVNISTISTQIMAPHQVHYIASKGGVDSLTRALALAMSPYRVRVNAVAPLGANTNINANVEEQHLAWKKSGVEASHRPVPLKRPGTPEDYANAVAYLVSEEASFVTGVVLPVDGGLLLR